MVGFSSKSQKLQRIVIKHLVVNIVYECLCVVATQNLSLSSVWNMRLGGVSRWAVGTAAVGALSASS